MEYFDANNIPEGFLRARFKTVSEAQTERLAELFAPVARALFQNASLEEQVRLGCTSNVMEVGKTSFIKRMLRHSFDPVEHDHLRFGTTYTNDKRQVLYHYDYHNIRSDESMNSILSGISIFDKFLGSIEDEFNQEIERVKKSSYIHISEWADHEHDNQGLNALWSFAKQANDDRELSFYCTDEIAAMPETQQFLEDAAPFMIK